MKKLTLCLILLSLIASCASNSNSARAKPMSIRYGEVIRVSRVQTPSAVPAGAVVGGFTGLVLGRNSNPGRHAAAGVGGALLGGLATSALQGDRRAYQYRIRYNNGSETDYITENAFFREGDCVSVERRNHANLRRVSDALCESPPMVRQVVQKRETEAMQCHDAKDQVLKALTQEEVEQAARKVRILCQF